ncbi:MAG: phosphate signaling complex protein PhoU [Rhodobacteraceae bacterium]|nr:phosphate signaling complex protein PhoU [Paracoccaceae bacterium]
MAHEPHIQSAFDRDLESIQALIMRMGGLVEANIAAASIALDSRDAELAGRARGADDQIDALDEMVNAEAARVLALRSPAATDLRTVLSVIKISGNLERCGDYAKNIAKRTGVLIQMPVATGATQSLRRMAREVELMLKDALDAYIQRDARMADQVRRRDHDVDQMYNAVFRELLTHMMEDPRNITGCMHLHFIAKNIERMGDHVTAIAEQVIFLVEGKVPVDARPKADITSTRAIEGGK